MLAPAGGVFQSIAFLPKSQSRTEPSTAPRSSRDPSGESNGGAYANGMVTWNLGNMASGQVVTVSYTAKSPAGIGSNRYFHDLMDTEDDWFSLDINNANEFFVLTREEAASRQLDESSLVPCIAGADSAMGPVFDNGDWQALQSGGRQAYLFDGAAQRMSSTSGGVELYIEYGERQGYHQRYLTKSRKPWYRLEQREVAPLLLAVFGRAGFRAARRSWHQIAQTAPGGRPSPVIQADAGIAVLLRARRDLQ